MSQPAESPWPARSKPKGPDYHAKRDAVIEVAARMFVEKGYENTTTNAICAELNISKPTLYYYVKDKAEMLAECRRRVWASIDAATRESEAMSLTGYERLEVFLRGYVGAITSTMGKALVMTIRAEPVSQPDDLPSIREGLRAADKVLEHLIVAGIKDGSIAPVDAKLTTFALYGALNWTAYWHHADRGASATKIADSFVALFADGLRPRT